MKIRKIASVLFFSLIILNNKFVCAWKGESLEKPIFNNSLIGGNRSNFNERDINEIKKYQRNFIDNFDTIMDELKKIFENRHLKISKGPNWFYNPINDKQFSQLKKIASKLNKKSKGAEFSYSQEFWNNYNKLRPTSSKYSNYRLNDLVKGAKVVKHHIIPYFLGGSGDAINCIELFDYEHIKLHSIINKIIYYGKAN